MIIKNNFYLNFEGNNEAWQYPFNIPSSNGGNMSLSGFKMASQYPNSGRVVQNTVTIYIFAIEGQCMIQVDGNKYTLCSGDIFVVKKGSKYKMLNQLGEEFKGWLLADGKFDPSTHKIIEG